MKVEFKTKSTQIAQYFHFLFYCFIKFTHLFFEVGINLNV